jgi:hypothetical protein
MASDVVATVRTALADLVRQGALTPDQVEALVAQLEGVLGARAPAPAAPQPVLTEGDLLTVAEAAELLRVSPRWLYRQAKNLPFARKLSRKVLRFSRSGIIRWLATKRL